MDPTVDAGRIATKPETTNIATMTSAELEQHIGAMEQGHRAHMRALRALARARKAEEAAAK